jgi:hypothetical protein
VTKKEKIDILRKNIINKDDIAVSLEKLGCKVIAEIGVRLGNNFRWLMKCNPTLAVAIDSWKEVIGKPEYNDLGTSQVALDGEYNGVVREFGNLDNVRIVRNFSVEASEQFPDQYFDFVYIDAAHTYDEVKKDLAAWYPKIKDGGILAGHDYIPDTRIWRGEPCGVYQAVNEFVEDKNLSVDHTTDVGAEGGPGVACTSYFIVKETN